MQKPFANKAHFVEGRKYPLSQDAVSTPPVPCEFKVGDTVTFTNDYGAVFHDRVVTGFSPVVEYGRFVYLDIDCWWFPMNPANLTHKFRHTPTVGSHGPLARMLEDVCQALHTLSHVASSVDNMTTPFLDKEKERIHQNGKKGAYNHVLEVCAVQPIEDWLNETLPEMQDDASVRIKLQDVARGLEIIEAALESCSCGDISRDLTPLTDEGIHLEAQKYAYVDALGYKAFVALREHLGAAGYAEHEVETARPRM